ncbi:hypothetical protein GTQ40_13050 [Flavobacteriaceae bacterium R38]|nr:hypothetical protein [Flavobacteriaceae bacterium R38]
MKKSKHQKTLKLHKLSIANLNSIIAGNGDPSGITINDPICNPDPDHTNESNCCSATSTLIPRSHLNTCNISCGLQCN